jgi:hypothetical protein
MIEGAIIAVAAAVIVIVVAVLGIRLSGAVEDRTKSESDRDRLEDQLEELSKDSIGDDERYGKIVDALNKEINLLRREIRRRRRPGDARDRLNRLGSGGVLPPESEAADPDHKNGDGVSESPEENSS